MALSQVQSSWEKKKSWGLQLLNYIFFNYKIETFLLYGIVYSTSIFTILTQTILFSVYIKLSQTNTIQSKTLIDSIKFKIG